MSGRWWMVGWFAGLGLTGCSDPRCHEQCPPAVAASTSSSPAPPSSSTPATSKGSLRFKKGDKGSTDLSFDQLAKAIPAEMVKQYDPYYAREKTYRAWPVSKVLELGFEGVADLPKQHFILRAKDGFTVPLEGSKLLEPGGYIAFEDSEVPGWEPIGQQRANPAPFYLVWANNNQTDLEGHPRPYQLAAIEIARFEDVFPRTVPKGKAPGDLASAGFMLFRQQCILCHAINRQGGRVGPELNVPQSIVEYRPADQIKAYIKNPLTFRYSTMPPHPAMTDAELDALIAYFSAMKELKQDDEKAPQPTSK